MKYQELYEDYNLLLEKRIQCINTLSLLPDGYISTKTISGKQYYYLQRKIDRKTNSEYIKGNMLSEIQEELKQRKVLEEVVISYSRLFLHKLKFNKLYKITKSLLIK